MRVAPPVATLLTLGGITATFLWLSQRASAIEAYGFIPAHPSLWNAFTSLFVHAHWLHWLKNALFLGLFGWYVERALGWQRWLVLYFASGLGSVAVHWAMSMTLQPSLYHESLVGASGAISGLVGYFALRFYRRQVRLLWATPARWGLAVPLWVGVVVWVVLQGVGAVLDAGQPTPSEVGYWAHLGGFATGLTLAVLWGAGAAGEREFLLLQAEQALQQGAAGDALRWLQPLLHQPDARALYLQGAAWAMLGDLDEAQAALQQSLRQALTHNDHNLIVQSANLLCEIERLHTLDTPTLRALFQHIEKQQDWQHALRWLETLTRSVDVSQRPEWLLLRARLLQKEGQTDAARAVLQQIMTDYPDSLQAAMAKLEWRS